MNRVALKLMMPQFCVQVSRTFSYVFFIIIRYTNHQMARLSIVTALMVISDLLEDEIIQKVMYRYVIIVPGARYAATIGKQVILMWSVES